MIDFWKTDILTKWSIPYVTMVGRRQFNIPISSEMVIFQAINRLWRSWYTHTFFAVSQTRYSCSFRFLCARLHTVIIRFLHLISQNSDSHFVKNESRNAQWGVSHYRILPISRDIGWPVQQLDYFRYKATISLYRTSIYRLKFYFKEIKKTVIINWRVWQDCVVNTACHYGYICALSEW